VPRILRHNGVGRLLREMRIRKYRTKRNNKQVPSHHIQMDGKFPFGFCKIRTDNGLEFQAKFHWHVED
jgi:hypothetical protein